VYIGLEMLSRPMICASVIHLDKIKICELLYPLKI
jgi:hypothetical protein